MPNKGFSPIVALHTKYKKSKENRPRKTSYSLSGAVFAYFSVTVPKNVKSKKSCADYWRNQHSTIQVSLLKPRQVYYSIYLN